MKATVKQSLLETEDPVVRLRQVFPYLLREVDSFQPKGHMGESQTPPPWR